MIDAEPQMLRDLLTHNPSNHAARLLLPAAIVFKGASNAGKEA